MDFTLQLGDEVSKPDENSVDGKMYGLVLDKPKEVTNGMVSDVFVFVGWFARENAQPFISITPVSHLEYEGH